MVTASLYTISSYEGSHRNTLLSDGRGNLQTHKLRSPGTSCVPVASLLGAQIQLPGWGYSSLFPAPGPSHFPSPRGTVLWSLSFCFYCPLVARLGEGEGQEGGEQAPSDAQAVRKTVSDPQYPLNKSQCSDHHHLSLNIILSCLISLKFAQINVLELQLGKFLYAI